MLARTLTLSVLVGTLPNLCAQQAARVRAIDRALDRMHAELTRDLDVWSDHSTIENGWQASTEHFVVRTTRSYGLARDIAVGLETMLGHFQRQLGTDYAPSSPLPIVILPSRAEYNGFGDQHGQEHSSFYGSFFARAHPQQVVAAEYHENPTLLRMHITHSVVHQYLHFAYPQTSGNRPVWIEEGLAAYFTFYWKPDWMLERFVDARQKRRLVRLERILSSNIADFRNDTESRLLHLSMFFDYLIRFREDTRSAPDAKGRMRGAFRDYLVAVLEGRPTDGMHFAKLLEDPGELADQFGEFEFPK
ncbi:MAG: hypothetical protein KAI24_24545 [Planctomycetes bacterium]|nr:hypothetical protein [Planctomycetota bacterium]